MLETYGPTALYCVLRLLTCIPPVVASITRNAPDENLRFGSGLVVFALALGLVVAIAYTVLLRSFMTGGNDGVRSPRSVLVVLGIGSIDMVGGLIAVVMSGGWGSPFWHMWLSALILPCLMFGMRWSLVLAAVQALILTAVLSVTGEGVDGRLGRQSQVPLRRLDGHSPSALWGRRLPGRRVFRAAEEQSEG